MTFPFLPTPCHLPMPASPPHHPLPLACLPYTPPTRHTYLFLALPSPCLVPFPYLQAALPACPHHYLPLLQPATTLFMPACPHPLPCPCLPCHHHHACPTTSPFTQPPSPYYTHTPTTTTCLPALPATLPTPLPSHPHHPHLPPHLLPFPHTTCYFIWFGHFGGGWIHLVVGVFETSMAN